MNGTAKIGFNLMKPSTAITTLENAQKGCCARCGARVAFLLTESEAVKLGFGDRWRKAMNRRTEKQLMRDQAKRVLISSLDSTVQKLLDRAAQENWSQRRLAKKIGIPESTFRLIRSGSIDIEAWLPKLEQALARLNQS